APARAPRPRSAPPTPSSAAAAPPRDAVPARRPAASPPRATGRACARPAQNPSGRRQRQIFFFQAEDGIRDATVTAVQTCALPISAYGAALATGGGNDDQAESVLHSVELQARIARRRRRAVTLASAICAAALFIVILSAGGWRARVKHRLDRDLQTLNAQATPALALQTQLATMQRVAA